MKETRDQRSLKLVWGKDAPVPSEASVREACEAADEAAPTLSTLLLREKTGVLIFSSRAAALAGAEKARTSTSWRVKYLGERAQTPDADDAKAAPAAEAPAAAEPAVSLSKPSEPAPAAAPAAAPAKPPLPPGEVPPTERACKVVFKKGAASADKPDEGALTAVLEKLAGPGGEGTVKTMQLRENTAIVIFAQPTYARRAAAGFDPAKPVHAGIQRIKFCGSDSPSTEAATTTDDEAKEGTTTKGKKKKDAEDQPKKKAKEKKKKKEEEEEDEKPKSKGSKKKK